MSSFIEIDGKKFLKVTEAAAQIGYSRDHVSKLARDKKIVAVQVARQWYVEQRSLRDYLKKSEGEQKLRQQKLSQERRLEREAVERKKRQALILSKKQKSSKFFYQVAAVSVLCLGIGLGFLFATVIGGTSSISFSKVPVLGLLSAADEKFPIAVDTKLEPTQPAVVFSEKSVEVSTLENSDKGILLLSKDEENTAQNPAGLFSDDVTIVHDEAGNTAVRNGDSGAEEIPFVVVPVTHKEKP